MQKIKNALRKLGTPNLVQLYGPESVESIANILQDSINEIKLVDLLVNKFGKQLLGQKNIRIALLSKTNHSELGYILDGSHIENRVLNKNELGQIASQKWGRLQNSSLRTLEIFDLDESYLPVKYETPPSEETITPSLFLYPHQKRLKDTFIRALASGENRLLIHMPTGAGKTRTSIEGVVDYWKANADRNTNMVWLAHSEELCEQAVETFSKIWKVRGDTEINLCRLWGNHAVPDFKKGNSFIVASFQKLYGMIASSDNKTYLSMNDLKNNCSFIIVDEAHKAIAPTYKSCITYLFDENNTKLVGLTATPGRQAQDITENSEYSETSELADFFNRNKFGLTDEDGSEIQDPISYLQNMNFLSKINRKKITTNIELELTEKEKNFVSQLLELPKSVLQRLAKSDERNAIILSEIAALRLKKRQIIVFALSVQHSHLITELLNLKGITAKCIDGNTPSSERSDSIEKYKRNEVSVLVNYGVLTTGFDAPNTNAIVIARPTASLVLYSQMIGRGIRGPKVGGNAECDLVDLEDNLLGFPNEQQAFNFFDIAWSDK